MDTEDYKKCAEELMRAFNEKPWNENWTFDQAYIRIDEMMSSRVSRGYVLYDGDTVVSMLCGRIMTYLDFKELWIDEFSVSPEYQRKGIGSKMLQFIRKELKKEKISFLSLNTGKDFPRVKFYEKNRFKEDGKIIFMSADA